MQYFTQLMSTELAVGNRAISFEASFPMSNAHFLGRVYQELLDPPSPLPFSLRDARAQPHLTSHCIPDSPYHFISSCLCIAFSLCLEYSLLTFPSGLGNASPSCKTQFNCLSAPLWRFSWNPESVIPTLELLQPPFLFFSVSYGRRSKSPLGWLPGP